MTRTEATTEARRRWGEYGHVWRCDVLFMVGTWNGSNKFSDTEDRGMGDSYESAFADADQREAIAKGKKE